MRRNLLMFSVVVVTLMMISCQKELSADNTNTPGNSGNFKATIEGTPWVADNGSGAYRIQGLINIAGAGLDKKFISITLVDSGVHTYTLNESSFNVAAYIDSSRGDLNGFTTNQGPDPGDAGGTVTITNIDTDKKTISGTFEFTVYRQQDDEQRTITAGSFTDIPYSTTLPPAATTDTFNVKIDNVLWKPGSLGAIASSTPIGNVIAISATEPALQKNVGLIFPAGIVPGSYTFDFFGGTYIGQYNPDTNPLHAKPASSGTLIILEHSTSTKRIRGTFDFHAEELGNPASAAELTEGYFSVTYQ